MKSITITITITITILQLPPNLHALPPIRRLRVPRRKRPEHAALGRGLRHLAAPVGQDDEHAVPEPVGEFARRDKAGPAASGNGEFAAGAVDALRAAGDLRVELDKVDDVLFGKRVDVLETKSVLYSSRSLPALTRTPMVCVRCDGFMSSTWKMPWTNRQRQISRAAARSSRRRCSSDGMCGRLRVSGNKRVDVGEQGEDIGARARCFAVPRP